MSERLCGLWHLDVSFTLVTDAGLTLLARGCNVLRKLLVAGCNRVTGEGSLHDINLHCRVLELLDISFVCLGAGTHADIHALAERSVDVVGWKRGTIVMA